MIDAVRYEGALHNGAQRLGLNRDEFASDLEEAIWAGDVDRLCELAHCGCCCDEHTFEDCPARVWYGCRGQDSMTRDEKESWQKHYETFHGMSWKQFYGLEEEP